MRYNNCRDLSPAVACVMDAILRAVPEEAIPKLQPKGLRDGYHYFKSQALVNATE